MSSGSACRFLVGAATPLCLLLACSDHREDRVVTHTTTEPQLPYVVREPATYPYPVTRLHMTSNEQLRRVTEDLQNVNYDLLAQDRDKPAAQGTMTQVANDVNVITREAERMNTAAVNPSVRTRDEDDYRILASEFHQNALQLDRAVHNNDPRAVLTSLNNTIQTCNACHSTFSAPAIALRTPVESRRYVPVSPRRKA